MNPHSVSQIDDFRAILAETFDKRCQKNPRYSLRAYARDLELSPSRLSEVLNSKQGLSLPNAKRIADKLGMSEPVSQYFCDLVVVNCSRNSLQIELAQQRIDQFRTADDYKEIKLQRYRLIKDWYHFAILELCRLKDFRSDCQWIGKRLGLAPSIVRQALARLERLNLVTFCPGSGQLILVEEKTSVGGKTPSSVIRDYHRQVLQLGIKALESQDSETRDHSAMTLAIPQTALPKAKEMLKEFRRNFASEMRKQENPDEVYCLALQLFSLETGEEA